MFQRSFYKQYGGVDYSLYGIKINGKYYDSSGGLMTETDFFNTYDKTKKVPNVENKTDLGNSVMKKLEKVIKIVKGELKLMTWNVFNFRSHGWNKSNSTSHRSFNEQMKLIKKEDPDIISMQEVAFLDTSQKYPTSYKTKAELIDKLNKYNVYIQKFGRSGKLQNVVAVKKTIESKKDETTFSNGTYKIDKSQPVNVKVTVNNKEIIIIGFHLPIKDSGTDGEKTAAETAKNILDKVLDYCKDKNAIIMGDFNRTYKEIAEGRLYEKDSVNIALDNIHKTLFKKYKYKKPDTKTGYKTGKVIDMILWRKDSVLSSSLSNKVIDLGSNAISDHNPVIQEINIK